MMTADDFNEKYKDNIPKGWDGLTLEDPAIVDYFDKAFSKIKETNTSFEIHQIKEKFGMPRVYLSNDLDKESFKMEQDLIYKFGMK